MAGAGAAVSSSRPRGHAAPPTPGSGGRAPLRSLREESTEFTREDRGVRPRSCARTPGPAWRRPPPPNRGLSLLPSLDATEPSQDSGISSKLSRSGSPCSARPRRTHGSLQLQAASRPDRFSARPTPQCAGRVFHTNLAVSRARLTTQSWSQLSTRPPRISSVPAAVRPPVSPSAGVDRTAPAAPATPAATVH